MRRRAFLFVPFVVLGSGIPRASADAAEKNVFVHIAAPKVVALERRVGGTSEWERVCDSPCDEQMTTAAEYRVAFGRGAAPGEPFHLRTKRGEGGDGGEVELTVELPSDGEKIAGHVVTAAGVIVAVAGVVGAIAFGAIASRTPNEAACHDGDDPSQHRDGGIACGLGEGIAGGLAIISGLFALVGGGLVVGGLAISSDADGHAKQDARSRVDAFVRRPTWRGPSLEAAGRPAMFVPLTFSF